MLRLEEFRPAPFAAAITEARANVMAGLGAASMESYRRAYPFLLKLHSLRYQTNEEAAYCFSLRFLPCSTRLFIYVVQVHHWVALNNRRVGSFVLSCFDSDENEQQKTQTAVLVVWLSR